MSTDLPDGTAHAPATQDPLEVLARVAARLGGASAAEILVRGDAFSGTEQRVVTGRSAEGDSTGEAGAAATVPLVADSGEVLGELTVHGPAELPDRAAALADVARVAAAVVEGERASARLFDVEESAARAEEQLTQVAGQIAHDLNNPLAAMAMSLEIARDQVDDSQSLLASLLERASGSAARMKGMTADLLAYAHTPSPGTTDLQSELERALRDLDGLFPGEVEVRHPLPTVAGQPGDYRVVLVALLENAVKFAVADEPVHVTVDAQREGEQWRISFADRGRGVPLEELERVFDPMVRLDKRVPGLGLGLSTARRVVLAHGGRVGIEANPGGGTVMWFTLPVLAGD